jgi:regulator of protease activity HflC (stomatin/prohibitin superfamily)
MTILEKNVFRWGRLLTVVALGFWMLILLRFAAWYIKRIPLCRDLPYAKWLRTSLLQDNEGKYVFYNWLSDFLTTWWQWSLLPLGFGGVVLLSLSIASFTTMPILAVLFDHFIKQAIWWELLAVVSFDWFGFRIAKSSCWDALIWRAEPAGRALLGPEYDKLTPEQKNQLHRHIAEVEAGINKGTWLAAAGEQPKLFHVPSDSFAKYGGPGILVVQEGHAVVTERSGRIERIVGAGFYQLRQYERPTLSVYLPTRAERVEIQEALTRDKMVIKSLELMVFHRADRGDQSQASGPFRYDRKIILEKIWSPKGGDWRDTVKAVANQAARDVIAQYNFTDLITISGAERQNLLREFTERINRVTQDLLGVEVIATNLGEIAISDEAKKVLEDKGLVDFRRQTKVIEAEGEKEAKITIGEGEREYLRKQGEGRALAAREESLAKAEGEFERVREMLIALDRLPIDDNSKVELLKTLFQGDQYRDAMRMWTRMGSGGRGITSPLADGGETRTTQSA